MDENFEILSLSDFLRKDLEIEDGFDVKIGFVLPLYDLKEDDGSMSINYFQESYKFVDILCIDFMLEIWKYIHPVMEVNTVDTIIYFSIYLIYHQY